MKYPVSSQLGTDLVERLGLAQSGRFEQAKILAELGQKLERRVFARLLLAMSKIQLAELAALLSLGATDEIRTFYERYFPRHREIAAEELKAIISEYFAKVAVEQAFSEVPSLYIRELARLDAEDPDA